MEGSIRILHVDDDPGFLEVTADLLAEEYERFDVTSATGPDEGLSLLGDGSFDCVVSDYDMDADNGIEFLERVRERHGDLPFILFTGKGSEEIASDAISAGVTDYLQKEGTVDQYALLANRIDNAVRARAASRDSNRRMREYETLIESAPVPMAVVDEEGSILYLNGSAQETLAIEDVSSIAGTSVMAFVHPEDRASRRDCIKRAVRERETTRTHEYRLLRNDDEELIVRGSVVPVTFDGEPTAQLVFTDITEHHQRTEQLKTLHAGTRELMEATDRKNVADIAAGLAKDILGYDYTAVRFANEDEQVLEPVAMTEEVSEVMADRPEYSLDADSPHARVYGSDERLLFEDVRDVDDSHDRDPVRSAMYLPLGDDGIVTICDPETGAFDQSDVELSSVLLANAEAALDRLDRQREITTVKERMQSFLQGTTDIITLLDSDGTIRYQSQAIEDILGYAPEELLGHRVFDYVHPEDRQRVLEEFAARVEQSGEGTQSVELRMRHADGSWVWLESQSRIGNGAFPDSYVITSRDISERKDREKQLKSERQRFSALFENFPEPTLSYRYDGEDPLVQSVNAAFEATFGYDYDEVVGEPINELLVPGDKEQEAKQLDERVKEGELLDKQVRRQAADGMREFNFRNIPSQGDEHIDGFAVYTDINKRVERERKLRRQNEHLDEFAGIIAHDLRNPLNVAQARTELLARERESDHLADIRNAHDRMETLLEETLTLARQGEMVSDLETVCITDVVVECHDMVGTDSSTVTVEDDVRIRCDRDRSRQLFENLISNAIDHGGDGVSIRVGSADRDRLYVEDDGPGIQTDDHERLFEPGYTTGDEGTGFGLAIVSRIVEAHGWSISVIDGRDGGARFEIEGVTVEDVR